MSATTRYSEIALGLKARFLDKQSSANRWRLSINGAPIPIGTDWKAESPFGSIETAVVLKPDGSPAFDRPVSREAPNVNIIAWGRDNRGEVKIGIIRQPRPHADDPVSRQKAGHAPVLFGQIPMGFIDRGEGLERAAARETEEETGASAVLRVRRPKQPFHNPNPTHIASWSDLLFVEVDLDKIAAIRANSDEVILSVDYISIKELLSRVANGLDEAGAYYRMCTANSALFIFFCTYPELWPRDL